MVQSGRSKEAEREAQLKLLGKEKASLEVVLVDDKGVNAGSGREIRP